MTPKLTVAAAEAGANHVLNNLWVRVEDGLPNDYERVICLTQDGTMLNMMYCDDVEEVGCWHCEHNHFKKYSFKNMGAVTHWMYIPTIK
jgi:hypothetical protein